MYSQKTKRNAFSLNSLEKTREWNDFVSVINKLMGRKNVEMLKNEFLTELAKCRSYLFLNRGNES